MVLCLLINYDFITHIITRYPKELDSFQHSELQNRDDYKGKRFVVLWLIHILWLFHIRTLTNQLNRFYTSWRYWTCPTYVTHPEGVKNWNERLRCWSSQGDIHGYCLGEQCRWIRKWTLVKEEEPCYKCWMLRYVNEIAKKQTSLVEMELLLVDVS